MDFSRPIAPWEVHPHTFKTDLTPYDYLDPLKELQNINHRKSIWGLTGKVQRELSWVAFPAALAKLDIQDHIKDDGSLHAFIEQPESINPETLIWKPEGLRILDELADSDEELEEDVFPDGKDFGSLIRKRKLELDGDTLNGKSWPKNPQYPDTFVARPPTRGLQTSDQNGLTPSHISNLPAETITARLPIATNFSALNALDAFLDIRMGQLNTSNAKPQQASPEQQPLSIVRELGSESKKRALIGAEPVESETVGLPTPSISIPEEPRQFIVSATIFGNRQFARRILALYPTAELVERDWSTHGTTGMNHPHREPKVPHNVSSDSLGNEADIIISPSRGLMTTSVQKIKQRSLPGQASHSALRERITKLTPRYEHLTVLVSHDHPSGDNLGADDSMAIAGFIAFCSALPTDIAVTMVAGGDVQMATWIVTMMVQHSISDDGVQLNQDETADELFLRRAGLNAFAAQAVLSIISTLWTREFRGSDGPTAALGIFVRMSLREKLARFEHLLGGARVLGRVHQVLEARW